MSILKKLGGAVKKTVKKVAKPVKKAASNKLVDKLSENDAMMGANLDMLRGDFGNLPNRLTQAQNQAQLAARMEAGDPTAYLDAASIVGSQNGIDVGNSSPLFNSFQATRGEPGSEGFSSTPWEARSSESSPIYDEAGRLLSRTANAQLQNTMGKYFPSIEPSVDELLKSVTGTFGSQIAGQKDYTNAQNVGQETPSIPEDPSTPWYKRLGSWIGDKASKRYSDVKGILGSEAAKPYLGGLAQVGGGIASNLYADKAMRDYISAVNQGQDLDVRLQGPSAMEGLTGTEEFGRMQEFARGGMTPAEEAARQESLRRQNQAVMANNQAIAESAQRRGLRGGQQLAQQMLGAQEGANRLSQDEQNLRAQMFGRSERATGDVLNTRSNIARSQDAQRAADAERMTQQALYRQQAKERSAQLGSQRKSGQGQIFASTGNVLGNIINPVKSTQPQNALGNFNQQHQETEEEKKRRLGQV